MPQPSTERRTDLRDPRPAKEITPFPYTIFSDVPDLGPPRFLWRPYIPYGTITLMAGPGKVGKSTISADIAAKLSRGTPLPGNPGGFSPAKTLLISSEDHLSHVLRGRMLAAGADMDLVAAYDKPFDLTPDAVARLEMTVQNYAATLIFIDPIVAYIGAKTDTNHAAEVRPIMNLLKEMAERQDAAVVVVHHTRKTNKKCPDREDIMGSVDFVNAARSIIIVRKCNGDRQLIHAGSNMGVLGEGLTFEVVDSGVEWGGRIEEEDGPPISRVPKKRDQTVAMVRSLLQDGPVPAAEVLNAVVGELKVSSRSVERALEEIGGRSDREGNKFVWYGPPRTTPKPIPTDLDTRGTDAPSEPTGTQPEPTLDPAYITAQTILAAKKGTVVH